MPIYLTLFIPTYDKFRNQQYFAFKKEFPGIDLVDCNGALSCSGKDIAEQEEFLLELIRNNQKGKTINLFFSKNNIHITITKIDHQNKQYKRLRLDDYTNAQIIEDIDLRELGLIQIADFKPILYDEEYGKYWQKIIFDIPNKK